MKTYNFCAGPAILPEAVLSQAQDDLTNWQGLGTSMLSISHRSPEFVSMAEQSIQDLRDLMAIPDDYEVLFLHGGATMQAVMIPLNFIPKGGFCNYVNTGYWANKAVDESRQIGETRVIASGVESAIDLNWPIDENAAFVHCTPNETIDGIEFTDVPNTNVPIIADLSSTILSRPIDVSKYDMIYAGAQKNIGPAGITVAIIKRSFLETAREDIPFMMQYKKQAKANSIYNTPPTFPWYLAAEVFKWVKAEGGLEVMAERNEHKAQLLYDAIDHSDLYVNKIPAQVRSWMNVPFQLKDEALTTDFLEKARQNGLINLKGHKSAGGIRCSIYNAMSLEGVQKLIEFMGDFERGALPLAQLDSGQTLKA